MGEIRNRWLAKKKAEYFQQAGNGAKTGYAGANGTTPISPVPVTAKPAAVAPATGSYADIKALGAWDYGASKQTRLNNTVNAGVKSTQSSLANIRGQLLAPTGELTIGQNAQAAVHGISQQTAEAEKTASQRKYQAKAYAPAPRAFMSA